MACVQASPALGSGAEYEWSGWAQICGRQAFLGLIVENVFKSFPTCLLELKDDSSTLTETPLLCFDIRDDPYQLVGYHCISTGMVCFSLVGGRCVVIPADLASWGLFGCDLLVGHKRGNAFEGSVLIPFRVFSIYTGGSYWLVPKCLSIQKYVKIGAGVQLGMLFPTTTMTSSLMNMKNWLITYQYE